MVHMLADPLLQAIPAPLFIHAHSNTSAYEVHDVRTCVRACAFVRVRVRACMRSGATAGGRDAGSNLVMEGEVLDGGGNALASPRRHPHYP